MPGQPERNRCGIAFRADLHRRDLRPRRLIGESGGGLCDFLDLFHEDPWRSRMPDAMPVAVEAGLLRADTQRQHECQHVERGIGPAHTAIADGRQQYRRNAGACECGEACGKIVCGKSRALLAFAGIQRHDGRKRREGAGTDTDDDRRDDHHQRIRTEPLRYVIEGHGTDGEHRTPEPTHRPHPAETVHEPTPEGVEDQCDHEYESPDAHPFLGFEDVDATVVRGAQVQRHDDREAV